MRRFDARVKQGDFDSLPGAARQSIARFVERGPGAHRVLCVQRSADFQSAVSPNCIRQAVRTPGDFSTFQGLGIENPRYSRLEPCATKPRLKGAECIPALIARPTDRLAQ